MSRFLDIVEGTMPASNSNSKGEMVDVLAELLNKIPSVNVVSMQKPEELCITIDGSRITLQVTDVKTQNSNISKEEDAENYNYDLDAGVEKLAAKANSGISGWLAGKMGSSYQKAKAAVRERDDVAKSGIDVYKQVTGKLRNAIAASKKGLNANIQVI